MSIKIACISDTHGLHNSVEIEPVDLLLHAGDFSNVGYKNQIKQFANWFKDQPAKEKVCIAGNHDFYAESDPEGVAKLFSSKDIVYLHDAAHEYEGLEIWGSPYQPSFGDWAFNLDGYDALDKVWSKIPDTTDILITHGPAFGRLDEVARPPQDRVGCKSLLKHIERVRPKLHLFGHIHEAWGTELSEDLGVWFTNASICTLSYHPTNPVTYYEWDGNDLWFLPGDASGYS